MQVILHFSPSRMVVFNITQSCRREGQKGMSYTEFFLGNFDILPSHTPGLEPGRKKQTWRQRTAISENMLPFKKDFPFDYVYDYFIVLHYKLSYIMIRRALITATITKKKKKIFIHNWGLKWPIKAGSSVQLESATRNIDRTKQQTRNEDKI